MHIKVFFISLFLFSKIFMSKYNIYFLKKIVNECYETRTEKKNAKKIKNTKVPEMYVYFSSSSSSSSLLHSTTEARAIFWGIVGLKTTKKGVGMKDRVKMVSFRKFFILKEQAPKRRHFEPLFKIKRAN